MGLEKEKLEKWMLKKKIKKVKLSLKNDAQLVELGVVEKLEK